MFILIFLLTESKIYASRRSKLRPEMISRPQGELKHTGHVGLDGAYFGDISFLGSGTKVSQYGIFFHRPDDLKL